jgi:tetratricopeptide (TPR) repeat protein
MPSKLGRGLDALISRKGGVEDSNRISELRAKLYKVEAEYNDLKDRTDTLRKKLTMEIVMGANPDMTELRSMEGRLLDLDLERREVVSELPEPPLRKEPKDPNSLSPTSERKRRSSEIDMDMIRIMIAENPDKDELPVGPVDDKTDSLVNETDEILKDLKSLQESHAVLEEAPDAQPLKDTNQQDAGAYPIASPPKQDPSYYQSIKNEISPKVILRKIKQEAKITSESPTSSITPSVVNRSAAPPSLPLRAYAKKKLVRRLKETPFERAGSKGELSMLLRRTNAMIEEGAFDEALPLLEAGMGKYGIEGDQSILCQIGSLFFEKGDLEKAKDRFRQVVRINPMNARAINNLGIILKKQKRYEESIRIINQAIEVDPNYERAWYELGCVFMEIEPPLLKEASIFLRRALELSPRFEKAREQLKICEEKMHPA